MIFMIAKNSTYANRTRLASSLAAPSTLNFNTPTAVGDHLSCLLSLEGPQAKHLNCK